MIDKKVRERSKKMQVRLDRYMKENYWKDRANKKNTLHAMHNYPATMNVTLFRGILYANPEIQKQLGIKIPLKEKRDKK